MGASYLRSALLSLSLVSVSALLQINNSSYETAHSWNSESQNIEQEISNDEVWNRCAQSFFKNYNDRSTQKLTTSRIPYFDIRYLSASGGFAFSEFLFRFNWPLFRPSEVLIRLWRNTRYLVIFHLPHSDLRLPVNLPQPANPDNRSGPVRHF